MLSAPRGTIVVLVMVVLAYVLFTGWWSNRRVEYFPPDLQSQMEDCIDYLGHPREPWAPTELDTYSTALADFHEPSLYRRPAGALRSVRFSWFPSFFEPAVVRIDTLPNGQLQLTATYKTQPREHSISRLLSSQEAEEFDDLLTRTRFFDIRPSGCMYGLDGQFWLLEGSDPSLGYAYRQQQSPRRGLEQELGQFMMGLTGWQPAGFPTEQDAADSIDRLRSSPHWVEVPPGPDLKPGRQQ